MEKSIQKQDLAARAAVRYYEYQQSQNEIAAALGISRSYVSQLLTYARDIGLVKITLTVENDYRREIAFVDKYPCKHAYIMRSDSQEFTSGNIGRFAAPHITRLINNASTIGVNLGETVQKVISDLDSNDFIDSFDKIVVQMMGGYNSSCTTQTSLPNELVSHLSRIIHCQCLYLNCPVVIKNIVLRDLILSEPSIKEVITCWERIDLALMGIGVANEESKTFRLLSEDMKDSIRTETACCDININYFNQSGQYLKLFEESKIAMPYSLLKNIKNKVVFGYGIHKANAILSALRAHMIDVLITDSITADAIEKLEENE
jgi:DNA-binding transcriptional regulator LsrR (DeoR family)